MVGGTFDPCERAKWDIYQEWTFSTDPANLQPRIRPLFRQVADHLREHPPAETNQQELKEVLESVGAPRGCDRRMPYDEILSKVVDWDNQAAALSVFS